MRRLAVLFAVMMVALAEAMRTVLRMVWRAGRWVTAAVAAPRSYAAPAVAAAEEALDALAEASLPAPAPTPSPVEPVPICHASDWGAVAVAYAAAIAAGEPEPDTRVLDEAALAWLRGLDGADIGRLRMLNAEQAGKHMLGTWPIPGLPLCPTLAQHYARLVLASTPSPIVEPVREEPAYAGPRLVYG